MKHKTSQITSLDRIYGLMSMKFFAKIKCDSDIDWFELLNFYKNLITDPTLYLRLKFDVILNISL